MDHQEALTLAISTKIVGKRFQDVVSSPGLI